MQQSATRIVGLALACMLGSIAAGCADKRTNTAREKIEAERKRMEATKKIGESKLPGEGTLLAEVPKPTEIPGQRVEPGSGPVGVGEIVPPFNKDDALGTDEETRAALLLLRSASGRDRCADKLKGKPGAAAALIAGLWHEDANVRSQSAIVIGKLGLKGDEITAAVRRSLRLEPDRDSRGIIAKAQVEIRDKRLVPTLIEVLEKDGDATVQANAAYALGAIGDPSATDALIKALAHKETWVRMRSVTALRRINAKKALPALVDRVKDSNDLVRKDAVKALQQMTGKKIGEDYFKWKAAVVR